MRFYSLAALTAACAAQANSQPSFITIGDLPGGFHNSIAGGTSQDGSVVTGYSYSSNGLSGFRWTLNDGMTMLPTIFNTGSYSGSKVSPSGAIIIGTDGGLGAVWSDSLGAVSIGDVPGGAERSFLYAVNDAGFAVGQGSHDRNEFNAPLYRAIKWTPEGGLETLPLPGGDSDLATNSRAWSVLDDGRVFGQSASGAWLYSESTGFEMLEGAEYMTRSNSDGTFFGGTYGPGGSKPVYWTREEGLRFLPLMDGHDGGNFFGMSDDGSVIVGVSFGPSSVGQVIWLNQSEPIRIVDFAASLGLDMEGWVVTNVIDVSADGSTIVGSARHTSWETGRSEGFVLTIPAPGAGVVVLAGGAMAIRRRRA